MSIKTITLLPAANPAKITDAAVFAADDSDEVTVHVTLAQLRTALGALGFDGDVTGTGDYGTITLTIANGAVTFAKMANMATGKLLGRSTAGAGVPEELTVGTGLSLAAGILSAAAPAAAAPSATLLTHRTFGAF